MALKYENNDSKYNIFAPMFVQKWIGVWDKLLLFAVSVPAGAFFFWKIVFLRCLHARRGLFFWKITFLRCLHARSFFSKNDIMFEQMIYEYSNKSKTNTNYENLLLLSISMPAGAFFLWKMKLVLNKWYTNIKNIEILTF